MKTETIRDIRKDGIECFCHRCRSGCMKRPGFFLPGEVARAAKHLKMTPKEFFQKHIVVDWWSDSPVKAFVLAPAAQGDTPGQECEDVAMPCGFLDENLRCSIHPVKPFECQQGDHDDSADFIRRRATAIHLEWAHHQGEIEMYLGRPPKGNE